MFVSTRDGEKVEDLRDVQRKIEGLRLGKFKKKVTKAAAVKSKTFFGCKKL